VKTTMTREEHLDHLDHMIKWFVWAGGERMPHEASMRGAWGYDAECTCGWRSATGGAVKRHVEALVANHKLDVSLDGAPQ
jgi:hypothetical protein